MMRMVGGHTIDVDLLPEEPTVLDVGCRYFDFSDAILTLRPRARIISLDPAPDLELLDTQAAKRVRLINKALVARDCSSAWLTWEGDGAKIYFDQVTEIASDFVYPFEMPGPTKVQTISFDKILEDCPYFDCIKLDCEGSEFALLENWPGKVATQISIEFHDTWFGSHPDEYFEKLFNGPLHDYRVVAHPLCPAGQWGYWHSDTLLILKDRP
jgi:FkbM family methyltransferase